MMHGQKNIKIISYVYHCKIQVAARSKAWVCGRSLAGMAGFETHAHVAVEGIPGDRADEMCGKLSRGTLSGHNLPT
jgi:hypothetical protein